MTDVKTILEMIESVDPKDTAKLDEIDARVWCWINYRHFLKEENLLAYTNDVFSIAYTRDFPTYTRCRTTLKSIRPEGWAVMVRSTGVSNIYKNGRQFDINYNYTAEAATEELAELHAIIQAISYERERGGDAP